MFKAFQIGSSQGMEGGAGDVLLEICQDASSVSACVGGSGGSIGCNFSASGLVSRAVPRIRLTKLHRGGVYNKLSTRRCH